MIITAGRRTAVLAFYLKKKFKDIKLIQIMQPNLPYNTFDAVILPYHDCRHLSSRGLTTGSSKNPKRHCEALDVIPAKAGIQKKVLEVLDSCDQRNDIGKSRNDIEKTIKIILSMELSTT